MIHVEPMLIVNLVVVVQSVSAEQVMSVIHLSIVTWSHAVKAHAEPTQNVSPKEDRPSVNVQEAIQETHTPIVYVILVQQILVVCQSFKILVQIFLKP